MRDLHLAQCTAEYGVYRTFKPVKERIIKRPDGKNHLLPAGLECMSCRRRNTNRS